MELVTYSRDELIEALRVVTHFLQAFPASLSLSADPVQPTGTPLAGRSVGLHDGAPAPAVLPGDGHTYAANSGKGVPQPPRKKYAPAAKVRKDRIEWDDLPRAARRIGQLVLEAAAPLTSHEIMASLEIARPTFNNAVSLLQQQGIVVATPVRQGRTTTR